MNHAIGLGRLNRYSESAGELQLAIELAIELHDGGSATSLRAWRVDALTQAGDHARAATEARELAATPQPPGETLYNLACVLALGSAAAKDDANLAGSYADEAVELLKRAREAGFFANAAAIFRSIAPIRILAARSLSN